MQDNPFQPPQAELADPPLAPGSTVKAVLAGFAVDVIGTMLVSAALGIVHAMSLSSLDMSPADIEAELNHIPLDSWVSVTGIAFGTVFSVIGGFVCSRISRRRSPRPGLILASILVVLGVAVSFNRYPLPVMLLLAVLSFGAVMLGATLGHPKR